MVIHFRLSALAYDVPNDKRGDEERDYGDVDDDNQRFPNRDR